MSYLSPIRHSEFDRGFTETEPHSRSRMQWPEGAIQFDLDQDIVDDELRAISRLTPPLTLMEESKQLVSSDLRSKLNQTMQEIIRDTRELPFQNTNEAGLEFGSSSLSDAENFNPNSHF